MKEKTLVHCKSEQKKYHPIQRRPWHNTDDQIGTCVPVGAAGPLGSVTSTLNYIAVRANFAFAHREHEAHQFVYA